MAQAEDIGTTFTDRRGQRVLDVEECLSRVRRVPVGRLLFLRDGDLVILPVNHALDGMSPVFRTTHGSKLEIATQAGPVAFEVDSYDAATESGWSVVIKGTAEIVYASADTDRYDALGLRSWADPTSSGQWIRVRADEISGREIMT
jgi:uncharacterized protein